MRVFVYATYSFFVCLETKCIFVLMLLSRPGLSLKMDLNPNEKTWLNKAWIICELVSFFVCVCLCLHTAVSVCVC